MCYKIKFLTECTRCLIEILHILEFVALRTYISFNCKKKINKNKYF